MAWWPVDTQQWCPWNVTASSYVSVRPNSADVTADNVTVARYPEAVGEAAPSYGVYTKGVEKFTMGLGALAFDPKPRDRLTCGGVTLTVLDVTEAPVMSFWLLTVVNLALAADLRSSGTLKRPGNTTSDKGKRVPGFAAEVADIPCRVQPTAAEQDNETFDAAALRVTATAFLGQQVSPRAGDVFEVGATRYAVVGWRDPERIDELMTLDLEEIPA